MEESEPKDETDNLETSRRSSESSERMMSPKQDEKPEKVCACYYFQKTVYKLCIETARGYIWSRIHVAVRV